MVSPAKSLLSSFRCSRSSSALFSASSASFAACSAEMVLRAFLLVSIDLTQYTLVNEDRLKSRLGLLFTLALRVCLVFAGAIELGDESGFDLFLFLTLLV